MRTFQHLLFSVLLFTIICEGYLCASTGSNTPPIPAPEEPGKSIFNLEYRGLTTDTLKEYGIEMTSMVETSNSPPDDFTRSLKLPRGKARYADIHFVLGDIAMEYDGHHPLALYADFNHNKHLDPDERLAPTLSGRTEIFITSDFIQEGNPWGKYRLRISPSEDRISVTTMCALEGQASFNGKPCRLTLVDQFITGEFYATGRTLYVLQALDKTFLESGSLSNVIKAQDDFYNLKISDDQKSVVLSKDPQPPGWLSIQAVNLKDSSYKISSVSMELLGAYNNEGHEDPEIDLTLEVEGEKPIQLPAYAYRTESSEIKMRKGEEEGHNEWRINFAAKAINIFVTRTSRLTLAEPKLEIRAVEPDMYFRADRDNTPQLTSVPVGQPIYFAQIVHGANGVTFQQFIRGSQGPDLSHCSIRNASGKEVISGNLAYDTGVSQGFRWETASHAPGKYTISVILDTGPLAGEITGHLDFILLPPSKATQKSKSHSHRN